MGLVIGNENYNWEVLEEQCEYKEGYSRDHPTIQYFWEAFRYSRDHPTIQNFWEAFRYSSDHPTIQYFWQVFRYSRDHPTLQYLYKVFRYSKDIVFFTLFIFLNCLLYLSTSYSIFISILY